MSSARSPAPYTIEEVAARWHEDPETVLRRIRKGEIACLEFNKRKLLVPASEVEAFESARMVRRASLSQVDPETESQSAGQSDGPSEPQTEDQEAALRQRTRLKRRARATR